MLKLLFSEELLGWLLLHAHSAGQAHTWATRHIASSHPNPALGNLWCALAKYVLWGNFHCRDKSLETLFYSLLVQ